MHNGSPWVRWRVTATVHARVGVALAALALVGLAWALIGLRSAHVAPALRAFTRLCLIVVGVQGALGIILVLQGHRPASGLHFLYGPLTLVAALVAAARPPTARDERIALVAGLGGMFLLAIRAAATGA